VWEKTSAKRKARWGEAATPFPGWWGRWCVGLKGAWNLHDIAIVIISWQLISPPVRCSVEHVNVRSHVAQMACVTVDYADRASANLNADHHPPETSQLFQNIVTKFPNTVTKSRDSLTIIIISGSTVLVRTLAASHWSIRNLIKTLGRTPLDEWSARHKDLYLHRTTQHRNTKTNIHVSSGIRTHEPSNQAAKTYALHLAATGTGDSLTMVKQIIIKLWRHLTKSQQLAI
jgi:hypothetical protein